MTVCQYYLEGRCRFGQNCRNEHSFNNDDRAFASTQQLKNIIRQIVCEVLIAEKGGQWPLSCFAPVKEGPNIPGWEDISPEEIRWKMYEARNNGTLNQCINEVNQLYSEAEKRRNALKQPSIENINLIVNMLKGKKESLNIPNPYVSSNNVNNSKSIFGGSPSTGSQNIFTGATCGNVFGSSTQPTASTGNMFMGNSNNFNTPNIFGGTNSSSNFNQNIFSNSQTSAQNLFSSTPSLSSNTSAPSQNIITTSQTGVQGNNAQTNLASYAVPINSGLFSHQGASAPVFGSPTTVFQTSDKAIQGQSSIFDGSQADVFNAQNQGNKYTDFKFQVPNDNKFNQVQGNHSVSVFGTSQHNIIDYSVYSKTEDLNSEELQAFAAATFTFGKIPLKPPPIENCK